MGQHSLHTVCIYKVTGITGFNVRPKDRTGGMLGQCEWLNGCELFCVSLNVARFAVSFFMFVYV